jgi:hypothetical protein
LRVTLAAVPSRLSAVVAVFACLAAPALAKHSSLIFRGKTSQRMGVRLANERSQAWVFRYQARMRCSDGSTFTDDPFADTVIVRRGRFSERVTTSHGAVSTRVAGTVGRRVATGTIRISERYSEVPTANGDTPLDPNGGILCDSGTVRWTARIAG